MRRYPLKESSQFGKKSWENTTHGLVMGNLPNQWKADTVILDGVVF